MTCSRCAELEAQVAEFERVFQGAIWTEAGPADKIARVLGISGQQAALLHLLFKAHPERLTSRQLTEGLPLASDSVDDNRSEHYGSVIVCHLRKRLGKNAVVSQHGHGGYALPPDMFARLSEILRA